MDLLESEAAKEGINIPATLFVKNIENVQGDEKDVIIFSIGYAPDKNGKVNMQFGSLNVAGGENRLNVAVTRAREKILVITSIWPEDLRVEGIKNDGPKYLQAYLEYARKVSVGKFVPSEIENQKQNPEWYLQSLIKQWSEQSPSAYKFLSSGMPFADLAVTKTDQVEGIILTDDGTYSQSFTVKEAHAYTPYLLNEKNWTYIRVFSRSWWTDREKVEHELTKYLYKLDQA